ncbi:hypothetical protein CCACVL1_08395 [Corchorus capsularis]|uniref:Uncharacterized protein n=1 Tax=Corchorus capsularis TaxID=210143 RepID=A0A1R3J0R7_COCAP|nr:hypothetical protein CCACVL1_08395 [Corchorus capsularis]
MAPVRRNESFYKSPVTNHLLTAALKDDEAILGVERQTK